MQAQAQHSNPCSELIPRQLKQGVAGVFDSSLSNDTNGYGVLPVNGNGHAYGGASTDEEDKSDGAHSDDWHHRDGSRQAGSGSEVGRCIINQQICASRQASTVLDRSKEKVERWKASTDPS